MRAVVFMLGHWEYYTPSEYSRRGRLTPYYTRFLNRVGQDALPDEFHAWRPPSERWGVNVDYKKARRIPSWNDSVFPARLVSSDYTIDAETLIDWRGIVRVVPDTSFKGSRVPLFLFDIALPMLPEGIENETHDFFDGTLKVTPYVVTLPEGSTQLRLWGVAFPFREYWTPGPSLRRHGKTGTVTFEIKGVAGDILQIVMTWWRVYGAISVRFNGDELHSLVYGEDVYDKLNNLKQREEEQ